MLQGTLPLFPTIKPRMDIKGIHADLKNIYGALTQILLLWQPFLKNGELKKERFSCSRWNRLDGEGCAQGGLQTDIHWGLLEAERVGSSCQSGRLHVDDCTLLRIVDWKWSVFPVHHRQVTSQKEEPARQVVAADRKSRHQLQTCGQPFLPRKTPLSLVRIRLGAQVYHCTQK